MIINQQQQKLFGISFSNTNPDSHEMKVNTPTQKPKKLFKNSIEMEAFPLRWDFLNLLFTFG